MKCLKCNQGRLEVKSNKYEDNLFVRKRVCKNCGYTTKTIEINYEIYMGIHKFIKVIRDMIIRIDKP